MSDPARIYFRDPSFDGQFARTLALAGVHASDPGECFRTARTVRRQRPGDWHRSWTRAAERAARLAADAETAGDPVGAAHAYLRASEYYRQAFYFIRGDLDNPLLHGSYDAHVSTFQDALPHLPHPAHEVAIPYEETTLHAYLFVPPGPPRARPTILLPCGYDSTAEAGWQNVPAALERDYNVLSFEGPGQGEALYRQGLPLRPDFEAVLTPVVDWLLTRPEADPAKVVLLGRSFGGYLVIRGAAFEHRLAGLVCDPAQPRLANRLPTGVVARVALPLLRAQMLLSENRGEFFRARMASHGVFDLETYFAELRRFDTLDDAARITCPTLIVEAENDFTGGDGALLLDALTAPSDLITLTAAEGADGHCGGLGQEVWTNRVYAWLAKLTG
ncbi:alpha/beta hydrolase family protein [Prauserella cavernicola]|uniref:Alpha/beta fold hydrolase n=1 Tax=Prauserella cavernicola TaxID=2800127 RepID=A0A934V789_9PSEU|nr:alpha/beta fold hydrolase [Prauserella cavernicola]MBK1787449.1 alpha/beta fold hydrolase [Prauserella cavernicola]